MFQLPPPLTGGGEGEGESAPPIIPWFGNQLVCGNSLVGARRQVFNAELLEENRKGKETWLDVVPDRVPVSKPRPPKSVYHFLLPDAGMANYTDRVVRGMARKETTKIKEWRKDFIRPFNTQEIETLRRLSDAVDKLWQRHTAQSASIRFQTRSAYKFFGYDDGNIYKQSLTTKQKDDLFNQTLLSENIAASSPFRRLKLVMDYWCALWFWPIQEADKLPSRDEFLMDLTLILEGSIYETVPAAGEQLTLLPDDRPTQQDLDLTNEFGHVNVDALCKNIERLALVRELALKHHFHHWELVFADIFADRGGFDLNVGNPPWIKIVWNESGIMGDKDPLFVLKDFSATKLSDLREKILQRPGMIETYLAAYENADATQNFLNAVQNYPLLKGVHTNLYKCFLPQAWYTGKENGIAGFLHPEGVYDDPGGENLRSNIYQRLRYHFQFQNELKLFAEIGNREKFSINIYENAQSDVFKTMSNLFHPTTVDQSFAYDGHGFCDGIKDDQDNWNLKGHRDRIVTVGINELTIFAKIYDEAGTPPQHSRLPVVHSQQIVDVLRKYAQQSIKLGDMNAEYLSTFMFHETYAQQEGTIRRKTQFPESSSQWILSGPHFYVAKPFHQTPKAVCETHRAYDNLDLTEIPDDYLPRTNYVPACDGATYLNQIPKVLWENRNSIDEFYRIIFSRRLSQAGERTMQPAIIPKKSTHVNTILSMVFKNTILMVNFAGLTSSITFDFFIKTTGRGDLYESTLSQLPIVEDHRIVLRTLRLNCLTTHYAELWEECWDEAFQHENWTKEDPRIDNGKFTSLTPKWQRNCALRTDYERRQALVEIDVLAAMALGLTLDELFTIYRIQFPVLRQNENDTWYEQNGRIVFTCSKGLPGVGFSRSEWNEIRDMTSGTVCRTITDDTLPGGPRECTITYTAPFDRCDREADYATAWAAFEKRGLK